MAKHTLNPTYNAKGATFDFPIIFLSLINSASSNLLYGSKIFCRRNTLAKQLCHLVIGSLIKRLGSKHFLVLATKSVNFLISLIGQLIFLFCSRSPSPQSLREWELLLVASRSSWVSSPPPILRIYLNSMKYSLSLLNAHDRPWSPLLL